MMVEFNHLLPAMPELGMGLPNVYRARTGSVDGAVELGIHGLKSWGCNW